jgi:hypothetical protein
MSHECIGQIELAYYNYSALNSASCPTISMEFMASQIETVVGCTVMIDAKVCIGQECIADINILAIKNTNILC